jgi:hypothetical protein
MTWIMAKNPENPGKGEMYLYYPDLTRKLKIWKMSTCTL